jgi:hypothetical protein
MNFLPLILLALLCFALSSALYLLRGRVETRSPLASAPAAMRRATKPGQRLR